MFNRYKPLALGLVHRRYQYSLYWIPLEDLEQDACAGLWKAVCRYDESRGVPFEKYAPYWIQDAIFGNRANQRMSRRWLQHYRRAIRSHDRLMHTLRRKPTIAEIARESGLKEVQVDQALQAAEYGFPASLEELQDSPEHPGEWEPPSPAPDPDLWLDVRAVLGRLSLREQMVIELFYFQGRSDYEIGAALGMAPEGADGQVDAADRSRVEDRVQQIRCRALKALRRLLAGSEDQPAPEPGSATP
jgi:RNA polymerase sigma factor (sigma-70 family)